MALVFTALRHSAARAARPCGNVTATSGMVGLASRSVPTRGFKGVEIMDKMQADLLDIRKTAIRQRDDYTASNPEVTDVVEETRNQLKQPFFKRWANLINTDDLVPLESSVDKVLNKLQELRTLHAESAEMVRSAPESIPPIDWNAWSGKIKDKEFVAELKAEYEKFNLPESQPFPQELQQELDVEWKELEAKSEHFSNVAKETSDFLNRRIWQLQRERDNLDNLYMEEVLATSHPLVSKLIEDEIDRDEYGPNMVTPKEEIDAALMKELEYDQEGKLQELYPPEWVANVKEFAAEDALPRGELSAEARDIFVAEASAKFDALEKQLSADEKSVFQGLWSHIEGSASLSQAVDEYSATLDQAQSASLDAALQKYNPVLDQLTQSYSKLGGGESSTGPYLAPSPTGAQVESQLRAPKE